MNMKTLLVRQIKLSRKIKQTLKVQLMTLIITQQTRVILNSKTRIISKIVPRKLGAKMKRALQATRPYRI